MQVLIRVRTVEIERYILEKYCRDRNKDIFRLMKCGKDRAESIKIIKLISTAVHALHYRFLCGSNIIMFMKMLYEKKDCFALE